jgi:hypothetical protein
VAAGEFERLINVPHEKAPQAKLAFNSQPADSDKAALRWLPTSPSAALAALFSRSAHKITFWE